MTKTKTLYGIEFKVYTDTKIDGDFIKPDEAVYFENDIAITGLLRVKYLKAEKSITVGKDYRVEKWETVGGFQTVGGSQTVGGNATIGLGMIIGLSVNVRGVLTFRKRLFAGACSWRDITDEEKTITCGKLVGGEVCYGIVEETDIAEETKTIDLSGKEGVADLIAVTFSARKRVGGKIIIELLRKTK